MALNKTLRLLEKQLRGGLGRPAMDSVVAVIIILILLAFILQTLGLLCLFLQKLVKRPSTVPISVNYHFTRRCNKACRFCFHTAKTSYILPLEDAKKGLALLKKAGMRKLNFAGGEPFLYPRFMGELIVYCKETLKLESVTIVTNGSKVTEKFFRKYGTYIDIVAVSCDSFSEDINEKIRRGSGDQVKILYQMRDWCEEYGIKFKINTVVMTLNHDEDMNTHIEQLEPFWWKCFQVLSVEGENESDKRLRDVRSLLIFDDQFESFCERHKNQECFVPEPNRLMAKSYLILDEYMRFLDRTGKGASKSILEVNVAEALESVYWDEGAFKERGGMFDWGRVQEVAADGCGTAVDKELDW
jgi:radical S-adenosyl methionine domain-containing protein 2